MSANKVCIDNLHEIRVRKVCFGESAMRRIRRRSVWQFVDAKFMVSDEENEVCSRIHVKVLEVLRSCVEREKRAARISTQRSTKREFLHLF